MGRMARLLALRGLIALAVLWAVFTLTFALVKMAPGGPLERLEALPPDVRANMAARYGLDQPLASQYAESLSRALRGDFGLSISYAPGRPVREILAATVPRSMTLGAGALLLAVLLGIGFGAAAGRWRGGWLDALTGAVALAIISASIIVISALLRRFFLHRPSPFVLGGFDSWRNMTLPMVTLGLAYGAIFQRLVRAAIAQEMAGGILTGARARGVSSSRAFWTYVVPQGLIPMLSYLGPAVAGILTGSFVVEAVFEVPGVAECFVQGAHARDYALVSGAIMVYTGLLVALNLLFETLQGLLDPRVRKGGRHG